MSETEAAISKIKAVKMIQIYDLTGSADLQCDSVPAVAVYYGDNQQMNLSRFDEHFDLLVDKILALYRETEDKSSLVLDEKTAAFLESGAKFSREQKLQAFYELEGSLFPELPPASALSKRFGPFLEYLVTSLYKVMGQEVVIANAAYGWRGKMKLTAMRGSEKLELIGRFFEASSSKIKGSVVNFPETGKSMEITILFGRESIDVTFAAEDGSVQGTEHYRASFEEMAESREVFVMGSSTFFEEQKTAPGRELSEEERKLLVGSDEEYAVYRLPWDTAWVFARTRRDSGGLTATDCAETLIYRGGYADTKGRTELRNKQTGLTITADSVHFCNLALKDGRLQTGFLPVVGNVTGTYREKLAGRFFVI